MGDMSSEGRLLGVNGSFGFVGFGGGGGGGGGAVMLRMDTA